MIMEKSPGIYQLFTSFLRLGITSLGEPSMVAYIRRMAFEKKEWLVDKSFQEGVALCQVIPGATAIQTVGFVGLKTRGIAGASTSFVDFGLPAFF